MSHGSLDRLSSAGDAMNPDQPLCTPAEARNIGAGMVSIHPATGGPLNIIRNLTAFLLVVQAACVEALKFPAQPMRRLIPRG
ncbi:hypothetical protein [Comamonas sp.]|uniref:hypothetical protein n=1 Tax=Comamonas sp. TaxID=34028 RepID=UPI00258D35BE|nr:hypothetical protein [Comamonas sp.]